MTEMDALRAKGQALLDAGLAYWTAAHQAGISGAVIWLQGTNGELVIFTRGEYKDLLLRNVDNIGPSTAFGVANEDK